MTTFVIVAGLILLNALFVAAEFAIVSVPRSAIARRAASGDRLARRVQRILDDPQRQDRYIATSQLGVTVASLGLGMYGEHALAQWLGGTLLRLPLPPWLAVHGTASVLAVALLTYLHIVLGEMVPKALTLQHAERTALWITPPMLGTKRLCYPLVLALNGLGNLLLRLAGIERQLAAARFHSPHELQLIIRESEESGLLHSEAGQLIRELFEFGELTAHEVMMPRVRVQAIPADATHDDIRRLLRRHQHTRYPVYQGDLDHIVGLVHIKDLLLLLLDGRPLATFLHPVPYVPETSTLDTVLDAMRRTGSQAVIVMDEFGGTAGLLTVEDLFEEVVGEFHERGTPAIRQDKTGRWRVRGTVRLDELGEKLEQPLEHEEVDTVSGLVLALLDRPAAVGDIVTWQQLRFQVLSVDGRGVGECLVLPDGGGPQ